MFIIPPNQVQAPLKSKRSVSTEKIGDKPREETSLERRRKDRRKERRAIGFADRRLKNRRGAAAIRLATKNGKLTKDLFRKGRLIDVQV